MCAHTCAAMSRERLVLRPRYGLSVTHPLPLQLDPLPILPAKGPQVVAQGLGCAHGACQWGGEVVGCRQDALTRCVTCGIERICALTGDSEFAQGKLWCGFRHRLHVFNTWKRSVIRIGSVHSPSVDGDSISNIFVRLEGCVILSYCKLPFCCTVGLLAVTAMRGVTVAREIQMRALC